MNVDDLCLAYACLSGVPGAAKAFEQRLRQAVNRYLKRIRGASDLNDEIIQTLSARFLVGTKERRPALADYRGRSTLAQFIGVCAQRLALNDRRDSRTRHRLLDRLANEMESRDVGVERELLRRKFRRPFEEALRVAVVELPSRERLLLRLHFVGGMSTRHMGRLFKVNSSTASRWLTDARKLLWSAVRRELRKSLVLESRDLDSILRSVRGGLDISLSSVLVGEDDADVMARVPRRRGG